MKRRDILTMLPAAMAVGALGVPGVALGRRKEFLIDRWGDDKWPGLRVRCFDPVTGRVRRYQYYLEHPSDEVVRYMTLHCMLSAREEGRFIPEITLRECRPEYRERIAQSMEEYRAAYEAQYRERIAQGMEEYHAAYGAQSGKLVRDRVDVLVAGPEDLLERYGAEIPSGWRRKPGVLTSEIEQIGDP